MAKTSSKTKMLVEGALMIALATVLSEIKIFAMPYGGSVTLVSMMPLIVMSFRNGVKWGVFTAFVYSLLQLILGLDNLTYLPSLASQIACVLFDYILAYTVLGLAVFFGGKVKNRLVGVAVGTIIVCVLRFASAVFSGVFVWGVWTDGWATWSYSLIYNGQYLLPETIITAVATVLLVKFAPKLFEI